MSVRYLWTCIARIHRMAWSCGVVGLGWPVGSAASVAEFVAYQNCMRSHAISLALLQIIDCPYSASLILWSCLWQLQLPSWPTRFGFPQMCSFLLFMGVASPVRCSEACSGSGFITVRFGRLVLMTLGRNTADWQWMVFVRCRRPRAPG